jgi:hypothetical protein
MAESSSLDYRFNVRNAEKAKMIGKLEAGKLRQPITTNPAHIASLEHHYSMFCEPFPHGLKISDRGRGTATSSSREPWRLDP